AKPTTVPCRRRVSVKAMTSPGLSPFGALSMKCVSLCWASRVIVHAWLCAPVAVAVRTAQAAKAPAIVISAVRVMVLLLCWGEGSGACGNGGVGFRLVAKGKRDADPGEAE